jgi:hypothetical protein
MDRDRQAVKAELFRSLYRGPPLLLLLNAWDAMSPAITYPEAQQLFAAR